MNKAYSIYTVSKRKNHMTIEEGHWFKRTNVKLSDWSNCSHVILLSCDIVLQRVCLRLDEIMYDNITLHLSK